MDKELSWKCNLCGEDFHSIEEFEQLIDRCGVQMSEELIEAHEAPASQLSFKPIEDMRIKKPI